MDTKNIQSIKEFFKLGKKLNLLIKLDKGCRKMKCTVIGIYEHYVLIANKYGTRECYMYTDFLTKDVKAL